MGVKVVCGAISVSTTGAATYPVDLSATFSAGEPLRAIIFQTVALNADGRNDGTWTRSTGFVTFDGGTIQQAMCAGLSADAGAASDTVRAGETTAAVRTFSNATPTVDSDLDVTTFTTTGFTLTASDAPAAAYVVLYQAIGGSDITGARCGMSTALLSTATQDVPVVAGFGTPTKGIFASAGNSADGNQAGAARVAFGVSDANGSGRSSAVVESDGAATMTAAAWQGSQALGIPATTELDGSFTLTAGAPTDNFRITWNDLATTAYRFIWLVFKPTSTVVLTVGNTTVPTAGAPQAQTLTPTSGTPRAFIGWSTGTADLSGSGEWSATAADLYGFSLGWTDGTTEGAMGVAQKDGDLTASTGRWMTRTKGMQNCVPVAAGATAPTLASEADVTLGGSDVTVTWTTTDATRATRYDYVLISEAAGAAPPRRSQRVMVGQAPFRASSW